MAVVNLPRDDLGTQRLEEANAARRTALAVAPLAASTALGPRHAPARIAVASTAASPAERRRGERRGGVERRAQSRATLLDTRSPYPRRTQDRRGASSQRRARGVDVYS